MKNDHKKWTSFQLRQAYLHTEEKQLNENFRIMLFLKDKVSKLAMIYEVIHQMFKFTNNCKFY